MKINMTNEVVKETLGDVLFIGAEIKRVYDGSLEEDQREIKSVTVSVGAEKFDKSFDIRMNKNPKTGLFNIPNAKKFSKLSFEGLIYNPRGVGNKAEFDNQTNVWGTLEEIFYADKIEAVNKAERIANENGERV